jgi:hypothetical protein
VKACNECRVIWGVTRYGETMPEARVELAQGCPRWILSPSDLQNQTTLTS